MRAFNEVMVGVGLVGEYINCRGKRRRGKACGRDKLSLVLRWYVGREEVVWCLGLTWSNDQVILNVGGGLDEVVCAFGGVGW